MFGNSAMLVRLFNLLANLSIFNVTVDFESLQELFELLPMIDEVKNGFERNFDMKRIQAQWMNGFEHGVAEFSPLLNMDRDQFRDLYNDFQTTLYGIAKIEAKSTLGFHVCLTMKNAAYPFACKYDECVEYFFYLYLLKFVLPGIFLISSFFLLIVLPSLEQIDAHVVVAEAFVDDRASPEPSVYTDSDGRAWASGRP